MASLGIRYGGNHSLNRERFNPGDPTNQNARSCSLPIADSKARRGPRISMATTVANSCFELETHGKDQGMRDEAVSHDRIDEWMRESVVEIVKNLREGPLLVHVYSNNNGRTKLKTKKAVVDDWPIVTGKWRDGETPVPEGVIIVEELKDKKDLQADDDFGGGGGGGETEAITKAWGIVIQGKGAECGPACYLLKTSRVRSSLGLFCTHFCLVKVKSFRETALSQLTNCWLLK